MRGANKMRAQESLSSREQVWGRWRQMPWAIAVACLVLGFMLTMQFKVQKQATLKDVTTFQRAEEMAKQLQQAERERDALSQEVEDLRSRMNKLLSSQSEYQALAAQLGQTQLFAGLIAVSGPGVTIVMNDSTRPSSPGENPNNFIIHDEDVLKVINELAAGGAEAIAVNGQRLIGRSEIRCTGPTITVNGVRTAPPIVITAVGNPAVLESAINMRGGVAEYLKQWGIQIAVKKESAIVIPAFKGSIKNEFAQPAREVPKS